MSHKWNYNNEIFGGKQNMGWLWWTEIQELEETDENTESEEE